MKKLARLFTFFVFFLFIYSPFVYVGGVLVKMPQVMLAVMGLVGMPLMLKEYLSNGLFRQTFNVKLVGLAFIILLFIAHGLRDYFLMQTILPGFGALAGAFYFIKTYRRLYGHDHYQRTVMTHIFLVGIIHGLIIVLASVLPSFSSFLETYLYFSEKAIEVGYRKQSGILFEGFSILSVTQAMTYICGLALLFDQKHKSGRSSKLLIFVGVLVIFMSIILCARLGLLVFAIATLMFAWKIFVASRRIISGRTKLFLAGTVVVIIGVGVYLFNNSDNFQEIANSISYTFEMFYSLQEKGTFESRSTNIIFDEMYFLPESIVEQLVGTGNFGRSNAGEYIASDIGYILIIFGAGYIGVLCVFLYYIYLGIRVLRAKHLRSPVAMALAFFCGMMIMVNFKDIILDHMLGLSQIFSLCYGLWLYSYADQRKRANHIKSVPVSVPA
jgi:hypothetical protein